MRVYLRAVENQRHDNVNQLIGKEKKGFIVPHMQMIGRITLNVL